MGFFSGKKAVVTGAGSGIGRALALKLADAGCHVAVTDVREERLPGVVEELEKRGVKARGYRVDHSSWEQVRDFADRLHDEWGVPDILCCNAGVGLGARFLETSLEDWEWVLGVNLWGTIYTLHAFVPGMVERRSGSILITASDAGLVAIPGMAAYQTSKYGVVGLGETLRMELYEHNVRVSILCPGYVNTNIIRDGRIYLCNSTGRSSRPEVERFYATRGVDPVKVAEAGLRALERDQGLSLVPWIHFGPQYVLKRVSPELYFKLFRFLWRKGVIHRVFGARP